MHIGIDFDNTLACYEQLFAQLATERKLLPVLPSGGRIGLRDALRKQPGGEICWQELQAEAYGPRLLQAPVFPGALDFLRRCAQRDVATSIVSHKTKLARRDSTQTNLRTAALQWMEVQGLFDSGLQEERVHFESTRQDKAQRIQALGCTHFIDDLLEVFEDPAFPPSTRALWFAPNGNSNPEDNRLPPFSCWRELSQHLLGAPEDAR